MSRVAIAAFSGWNDAGDAATGALEHVAGQWTSRRLSVVDGEEYTDFQVTRPQIRLDAQRRTRIDWPETTLDLLTSPRGQEIVAVRGPEPSLRWRGFATEVLDRLEDEGVSALVVLGALLADVPHTRPLPVSARVEPGEHETVDDARYEGPIGIPTVLAREAVARGLRTTSIWVQIPHYVAQGPNPKGILALLHELESALPVAISTGDLEEEAAAWVRGVDELARTDQDIEDYVRRLEGMQEATEVPEATGDAIARDFQRFLRRQRGED